LYRILKDWVGFLESADPDKPARLLESLATANFGIRSGQQTVKSLLRKRKPQKEK